MLYSILFAAVVAFTRTEQVGDVAVSCDEGAGWTFSASAAKEDGAETVTVSLSAPNECHPPKFDVDFRFSGADVHHVWSTDYSRRDMTLWPGLWPEGKSYVSQLAREAPLLAALNANDRSRLTMAASEAFNRVHYGVRPHGHSDAGLYADGEGVYHASLHANAAALAFGLVPEDRKARVADFLVAKGMACSVYFSQYLLEALFECGRAEDAIQLMTSGGEHSWLGMMAQGSTITMEAWNLRVKPNQDWNHAWGTPPLNIISRYVLGIEPLRPGFSEVSISPQIGKLKLVEGCVPTPHGAISVRVEDGKVQFSAPETIKVKKGP